MQRTSIKSAEIADTTYKLKLLTPQLSYLPLCQKRSLWLFLGILLFSVENSSTSAKSSPVANSSAPPHPDIFSYKKRVRILINLTTMNHMSNYHKETKASNNSLTLLSPTNSTNCGVFLKLRSANNCIWNESS